MVCAVLRLINLLCAVLLGYIGIVLCQCKPEAYTPPEVNELEPTALRCSIRNQNDCINNILSMIWQKGLNYGDDVQWQNAYRMYTNETGEVFNLPERYSLEGRDQSRILQNQYDLQITDTSLRDSGRWKCIMERKDGTFDEGGEMLLTVTKKVQENDIDVNRLNGTVYIITQPYLYECAVAGVYPEADIVWFVGNVQHSGTPDNELGLYLWNLRNTITLTARVLDEVPVTCSVQKSGSIDWETNITKSEEQIETPAWIESTYVSTTLVNINDNLTLSCTASGVGTNIHWFKDNDELIFPGNDLFVSTSRNLSGDFKFGQHQALENILIWKPPTSDRCKYKTKHEGVYQSKVFGIGGTESISKDITISFEHIDSCLSEGGLAGIIIACLVIVAATASAISVACCYHYHLCYFAPNRVVTPDTQRKAAKRPDTHPQTHRPPEMNQKYFTEEES